MTVVRLAAAAVNCGCRVGRPHSQNGPKMLDADGNSGCAGDAVGYRRCLSGSTTFLIGSDGRSRHWFDLPNALSTMPEIISQRLAATIDGHIIGIAHQQAMKSPQVAARGPAMNPKLKELEGQPESGFLGYISGGLLVVQYRRSF